VTHTTIKNCFNKADGLGIPLRDEETDQNNMDDEFNMEELIDGADKFPKEKIREFESILNDDSEEFIQAVFEDIEADLHLTEGDPVEDDEEELMDQDSLNTPVVTFAGWDAMYQSLCQLHTDLYHPCAVETVDDEHEKLVHVYENLKRLVRKIHQQG